MSQNSGYEDEGFSYRLLPSTVWDKGSRNIRHIQLSVIQAWHFHYQHPNKQSFSVSSVEVTLINHKSICKNHHFAELFLLVTVNSFSQLQ